MSDDVKRYYFNDGSGSSAGAQMYQSASGEYVFAADHDRAVVEHVKAMQVTEARWRKATDDLLALIAAQAKEIAWNKVENEGLRKTRDEYIATPESVRRDDEVKRLTLVNETWKSGLEHQYKIVAQLRADVVMWEASTDKQTALIIRLQRELETARRVREKLTEQRNECCDEMLWLQYDWELEAIEKDGTK